MSQNFSNYIGKILQRDLRSDLWRTQNADLENGFADSENGFVYDGRTKCDIEALCELSLFKQNRHTMKIKSICVLQYFPYWSK